MQTMTDKELLELAAKAADMDVEYMEGMGFLHCFNEDDKVWNPLTDDGDALRLSVKLNLVVDTYSLCVCYHSSDLEIEEHYPQGVIHDIYAATRLAIVRAAAEIGKSL